MTGKINWIGGFARLIVFLSFCIVIVFYLDTREEPFEDPFHRIVPWENPIALTIKYFLIPVIIFVICVYCILACIYSFKEPDFLFAKESMRRFGRVLVFFMCAAIAYCTWMLTGKNYWWAIGMAVVWLVLWGGFYSIVTYLEGALYHDDE